MATKTINLTGAEVAVTGLDGAHAHIRNDGTEVIYAAKTAGITAGADGVASIPAGQSDTIRGISGAVYLLGTGSVLIQSDDYVASPFKTSAASGGSGADEVARTAINTHAGNDEIHVTAEEKAMWNGKAELADIPTTLPANGGNADTLDGLHANEIASNPNLLINPDFKINQRGETAWSIGTKNAYFVDRWYSARTNLSLSDDGLMLAWNGTDGSDGWIQEKVETKALFGKTVTISVNANDKIYTITDTIPETVNVSTTKLIEGTTMKVSLTNHGGNTFAVVLYSTSTTPSLIRWIKCELGSIATPFTPPDPATELLKCQRYFYRLQSRSSGNTLVLVAIPAPSDKHYSNSKIFLPVCMRLSPTVTIAGTLKVLDSRNTSLTISDSSVSPVDTNCNIFNLNVKTSTATTDAAVTHELGLNSYIDFSAEL